MKRRVVITGMGAVCSAGSNVGALARSVLAGASALTEIGDRRVSHLRAKYAGTVPDQVLEGLEHERGDNGTLPLDRYAALALRSAGEALADSGIEPPAHGSKMATVFATCSGPMLTIERYYQQLLDGGTGDSSESELGRRYYSAALVLANRFGIGGPNLTVTTACSASVAALGTACDLIALGIIDVALVGGADSFSLTTLAGFDALKATAEGDRCAPFSKPVGLNLGEGAAFVIVESREAALARGATIRAEVLGFGSSNDAYHATSPDPSGRGQALAMKRAVAHAGVDISDVTYVNAHGTGTAANDKTETKAMRRVFGDYMSRIPVSSLKGVFGHCLGAAGLLEAVSSIAAAEHRRYLPTANFTEPREGCTLDYIPEPNRPWPNPGLIMTNNFAFGGNNVSVILRPAGEARHGDTATGRHFDRPRATGGEEGSAQDAETSRSGDEERGGDATSKAANPQLSSSSTLDTRHSTPATIPVCITGIGIVSSFGTGTEAFVAGLRDHSGDPATSVGELDIRSIDRRLDLRNMDRTSQLAAVAARLALTESGLGKRPSDRRDLGLFMHCAHAPQWAESEHISSLLANDFRLEGLGAFPYIVPNSVSGNVCKALMLTGHNSTFCLGPGAGLAGLGIAAAALRNGHLEAVLSGSADACEGSGHSSCSCAEGAVVFVLETQSHAQARGVRPLGHICGTAYATDTSSVTLPDSGVAGLSGCVDQALAMSGIEARDIGAINADTHDSRVGRVLDPLLPSWREIAVDHGARIGPAESSSPALSLAAALLQPRLGAEHSTNYILSLHVSPNGCNYASVVRTGA